MSLSPDEIAAVLRLKGELDQVLPRHGELVTAVELAAGKMRDMLDPPALRGLRLAQEQLLAIVDPPYLRELGAANLHLKELFDPHTKTLADAFAGVTANIDRELLGSGVAGRLADQWKSLSPQVEHFAGLRALMSAESLSSSIVKSLGLDMEALSGLSSAARLLHTSEISRFSAEYQGFAGCSTRTEELLASLDVGYGVADLLSVSDITRSLVGYETARLNRAFAGLSASIVNRPEWLESVPDFIRTTPGEIVFTQARFVRTVTTHDPIDEEDAADEIWTDVQTKTLGYVEAVLPELNPKLMKSWEGAWGTARGRGPDWARHSASSLRFLLIEVLDNVAPPDEVKKSGLPARYIKDGKILRLGQIHWLCEPLKNRTYVKVVRADLDSAMTIIEAMNEAVHRDDYEEIEDAFRTMAVRAAVALSNLLRLWKARH